MKQISTLFLLCTSLFAGFSSPAAAQRVSEMKTHEIGHRAKAEIKTEGVDSADVIAPRKSRLVVGGYGEAVMQRMFYNDNVKRYTSPQNYTSGEHGRFDLPHVVFYMSYDLGRGWKLSTEIEFEHGGAGTTYEVENEETGEYETEVEKGGEVALEQFWIEKSFSKTANLRMGHIIVPVGLTNQYHMPTEFFTVLRPEESTTILPSTWHETGISFWGVAGKWRYEAQFLAGLDADRFGNANWIAGGSASPYEFKIANSYGTAARIDNFSLKGLRIGVSGYYGHSATNSMKQDRYEGIKGAVAIGSVDAVYDDHHVVARANLVYGHLSDSKAISEINRGLPAASPSPRTGVGSAAMSWFVEAGYDVLSFFGDRKYKGDKLYVYGHYGFCDSMYKTVEGVTSKGWSERKVLSAGLNYFPMKGLVVKGEYSLRKLKDPFNNEPTLSLGIAYAGLFQK